MNFLDLVVQAKVERHLVLGVWKGPVGTSVQRNRIEDRHPGARVLGYRGAGRHMNDPAFGGHEVRLDEEQQRPVGRQVKVVPVRGDRGEVERQHETLPGRPLLALRQRRETAETTGHRQAVAVRNQLRLWSG